jgi:hypothetical protein
MESFAAAHDDRLTTTELMRFRAGVGDQFRMRRVDGARTLVIAYFTGGDFEGPLLKGRLLPGGGDWAVFENSQLLRINVRGILETEDNCLIFMRYWGLWATPPGVLDRVLKKDGQRDFLLSENYLRVTCSFETEAPRYAWLNTCIALGIGSRTADGVAYRFFRVL